MTYMLRHVPPDLWAQVTAKAKADGRPLRALVLDLLRAYVKVGVPRLSPYGFTMHGPPPWIEGQDVVVETNGRQRVYRVAGIRCENEQTNRYRVDLESL